VKNKKIPAISTRIKKGEYWGQSSLALQSLVNLPPCDLTSCKDTSVSES